ncbi:lipopolysaccharide assembly protein LapB [Labrenzia sp. VG12]|uniref:tetratricopeptide repeat protein n=1 Tax=Labrenzia sp. VG12 TaxID=2021862 RepID=UPI000B8C1D3D|nr:tetratricopeptide repeat protein [Labrenzia sp. VG12]ASP32789.1 hypothetical protein CHH27_05620 [Labrenzia sp. VG12]
MTAAARKAFDEAVALETAGQVDKALVSYLKAQELSPDDTEIAYRTASALLQNGYLDEALSQLRRIVFAEPDNLNARASLGNCHLLMNDYANAEQCFAEVLANAPESRNALYGLASVLLKEDRSLEAVGPARQLLDLLPDSAAALSLFAETQSRTDQMAAAIAAYRKALKLDPDYGPALTGLCQTLLLRKRFDEVIELALRACENAPADPVPLELLSDALQGKGHLDDAVEAAEAALKLNPRSATSHVRLSTLSRKRADHTAALRHALAAHDLDMGAREPLNALGAALAALKYPGQARSVLTCLVAGSGLDSDVRQLVKELIQDIGKDGVVVPKPVQDLSNAPSGEAQTTLSTESDISGQIEAGDRNSSPQSPALDRVDALLTADDNQLPNVLGLRRQDRT